MARSDARRDGGYALLIVLFAMVMLALLTAQVTSGGRAETKIASAFRLSAQLEAAADGAIYETIWHMLDGGGDMWPPGAQTRILREATGPVTVEVTDERGKMDLNQVPPPLLAGLFSVLGADRGTAQSLATNIGDWRSQSTPGDALQSVPPEYRMDGRAWGPPGQEFEHLDELLLVRGMTPALYQTVLPYLTLNLEQAPWLNYAGPVVQAALNRAKQTAGVTVDSPDNRGPIVLRMTATATGPGGARFIRHVFMRLDGSLSGPPWKYRFFDWE